MKQFDYGNSLTSALSYGILASLVLSFVFYMGCSTPDKDLQPEPPDGGSTTDTVVPPSEQTIWEYMEFNKNGEFSILLKVLEDAGLKDDLDGGASNLTLFAVLDRGFNEYIARQRYGTSDEFYNDAGLPALLSYHLVTGSMLKAEDLPDNGNYQTPGGENIFSQKSDDLGVYLNGRAKVTTADIETKNGIIHVLDDVMEPATQNMLDYLKSRGNFTTLVSLVEEYSLEALLTTGQRTIFAPNDQAFASAVDFMGNPIDWSTATDVMKQDVLANHILPNTHFSFEFIRMPTYENLATDRSRSITAELANNGDAFVEGYSVDDDSLDYYATNGAVHIINNVLVPPPTLVDHLYYNPDEYDTVFSAVEKAGLVSTLDEITNATLFVPTDQSFSDSLMAWYGSSSVADLDATALQMALLYHVVPQNLESGMLVNNKYYATALAPAVRFTTDNGGAQLVDADANAVDINQVDLLYTNGVVHVISGPVRAPRLSLLELVQFQLTENGEFEYLDSAIQRTTANPDADNLVMLLGDASQDLTALAPVDAAFETLLNNSNVAHWNHSVENIPLDTLTMILKYHVISGSRIHSTDLVPGTSATTMEGSDLNILNNATFEAQKEKINLSGASQTARPVIADVMGTNGVAHAIDNILLP